MGASAVALIREGRVVGNDEGVLGTALGDARHDPSDGKLDGLGAELSPVEEPRRPVSGLELLPDFVDRNDGELFVDLPKRGGGGFGHAPAPVRQPGVGRHDSGEALGKGRDQA